MSSWKPLIAFGHKAGFSSIVLYLCSYCGLQEYYNSFYDRDQTTDQSGKEEARIDYHEKGNEPARWRQLPLDERSDRIGKVDERETCQRPPRICESLRFLGKHQWKRFLEERRYVFRCIHCGIYDRLESSSHYVTALGILDRRLPRAKSFRRFQREIEENEDSFPFDDGYAFMGETITDKGQVYDVLPVERGLDASRRSREDAPTEPLEAAVKERKARYRKMDRHREIEDVLEARFNKEIRPLIGRVIEYVAKGIDEGELREQIRLVEVCLRGFDRLVSVTESERMLPEERWLSSDELKRLIAAATYHYFPSLTQDEIAGTSHSIFPELTVRTLRSYWANYITRYATWSS